MRRETLIISGWSSECGNCGRGCNPDEKQHSTNLGYGITDETRKGCGIEWRYVSADSVYPNENLRDAIKRMRPDLIYVELFNLTAPAEGELK